MEKDFLFTAGHTLSKMRLTVEGAVLLYESDVAACYQEALASGRTDEALALDMLGTVLHELRQDIAALQAALVKSNS